MRLHREVSLGIGAVLVLQILLSMLAIALLTRMGPAIERILQENVYSEQAVEEMLAALAAAPPAGTDTVPAAFEQALRRAQDNVTEEEERPLLATITRYRQEAFAGAPGPRAELIESLRQLGQVNRASMLRADLQAQRLGQAGAWAAAILGALALGLGIVVYRRLRLRLELPIEELRQATQRIRAGNLQARCPTTDGPAEIKQIAADLNWLLDRLLHETTPSPQQTGADREADLRRLLASLLDRQPGPVMVLDDQGRRIAASQDALDLEIPPVGEGAPKEEAEEGGRWLVEEIPQTSLRLLHQAQGQTTATAAPRPVTGETAAAATQGGEGGAAT